MTRKESVRVLSLPPFKGEICADYDYPSFIDQLDHMENIADLPEFKVLFTGRNRLGKMPFVLENGNKIDLIIKEFRIKGINRIKSLFLPSKARRAWNGAMALWKKGVNTPKPVAFLEWPRFPGIKKGYFITESLEGFDEIRHLLRDTNNEELKNLVRSLAEFVSSIHSRGIIHRDLSDGNVLAVRDKNRGPFFYLIDTNRIRARARLGKLRRIKNLIRLGIPEGLQSFFLEIYMGDHSVSRGSWFWYRFNKKTFERYLRLKKILRVKKLAEILRIQ